jgi:uncharacterized RDD family membrane protein YckC
MGAIEVCRECGQKLPAEEMIQHGSAWVCAKCKPVFLQKLQEGVSVASGLRYAGFWIRFGAKFLDGIIMNVIGSVVGFVIGIVMGVSNAAEHPEVAIAALVLQVVIGIAIGAIYNTFLVGRYGATFGKMACGLRVVTPEGENISYLRALGRHFAEMLSGIIMLIGYIMAAFDDEKRALHDRICETRVVYK